MNTAVINLKIEKGLKKKAQQTAEELGFSLSSLITAYLKQLTRTKTITFSTSDEEPTEFLLDMLKRSEEDIKVNRIKSFKNSKVVLSYLDTMIKNDKE